MPVIFSFDLPLIVLEIETQASSIQDRCSIPKPHHLLFPPCLCDSLCIGLSANRPFFKQVGALLPYDILKFSLDIMNIFISFKLSFEVCL